VSIKLIHEPIIVGENGHLLAIGGGLDWIVVVTREALDVVTLQHDATVALLRRHSDMFLEIAELQLAARDFSRDRIWINEEDVELWLASSSVRASSDFPALPENWRRTGGHKQQAGTPNNAHSRLS